MSADRLNNFTLANLHYSVRKHVNRARRHGLRIERLESLDPYWSDLQAIAISKYERTSYGRPTTYYKENFDEWRASLLKEFLKPGRDWWGVFAENRLGGYLYGYRIENTQFLRVYKIHSDFLKLQASYLLYFSVLDYCRDLPGLVQVNAGRSGLTRGVDQFQQKQGFELKETFEYTHYNWAVKMILKKLKRLSPLAREDVGCSSKRLGRLQNLYQHALRMADRLDNGERY